MTINDYLQHILEVKKQLPDFIAFEFIDNEQLIIEKNQQQLYDGKNVNNEDIRPFYSQDPYFKRPGASERYIAWKQKITPNPNRNPDAPNLFIDGTFHRTLKVGIKGSDVIVQSNSTIADDINFKYDNVLGLTDDNIFEIYNEKIHPKVIDLIEN